MSEDPTKEEEQDRDMAVSDKTRGVYAKYRVTRTDGSSENGGKHASCRFFVLDLDHDPHARAALAAYAASCAETHPELASELDYTCDQMRGGPDPVTGQELGWKSPHVWGAGQ